MKLVPVVFLMLLLMPGMCAGFEMPNESELEAAGAYAYLNNVSNVSMNVTVTDSTLFSDMLAWNSNESEYDNLARMTGAPYNYWVSLVGYWFYVALMIITLVFVHGKLHSIEVTGMVTMFFSLLIIIPSAADKLIVPSTVMGLLYVFGGLGFGAILYGLLASD